MIFHKNTDLLNIPLTIDNGRCILAHGVNCMGVMNSGIAKQIREKYPDNFIKYSNYINEYNYIKQCKNSRANLLGQICYAFIDTFWIANCFTQYDYGYDKKDRFCYYNFENILESLIDSSICSKAPVFMPMIGAGLAGGDWKRISSIIEEVEKKYSFVFNICVL